MSLKIQTDKYVETSVIFCYGPFFMVTVKVNNFWPPHTSQTPYTSTRQGYKNHWNSQQKLKWFYFLHCKL